MFVHVAIVLDYIEDLLFIAHGTATTSKKSTLISFAVDVAFEILNLIISFTSADVSVPIVPEMF